MRPSLARLAAAVVAALLPLEVHAQAADSLTAEYPAGQCAACAGWNAPRAPFRIFGNTHFVGTAGLSAILVTSPQGHVLIDGGIPASAPQILANVRALGFRVADIRMILNSHVHFDHAGGIAAIQRASGARLAATASSAPVLASGRSGPDDPQYGTLLEYPAASVTDTVKDGQVLHVGPLALTAHVTAGHTPGGTTWTWRSCEGERCVNVVYADSQSPISADGFRYSGSATYPSAVADFRRGFALLERLPCDILVTPHPGALFDRASKGPEGLIDTNACRAYAATARAHLARRLEAEGKPRTAP
jgi:metallo-beta-lactamase class B